MLTKLIFIIDCVANCRTFLVFIHGNICLESVRLEHLFRTHNFNGVELNCFSLIILLENTAVFVNKCSWFKQFSDQFSDILTKRLNSISKGFNSQPMLLGVQLSIKCWIKQQRFSNTDPKTLKLTKIYIPLLRTSELFGTNVIANRSTFKHYADCEVSISKQKIVAQLWGALCMLVC